MTLAAAKAFVTTLAPKLAGRERKFRFVFCSGMGAEWDQDKSLMFLSDTRKIKVRLNCLFFSGRPYSFLSSMAYLSFG